MPNKLYRQLNQYNPEMQNPQNLISKFNEFRSSLQGDPKQIVQQLLNSGRMSQQEYNRLSQMANEFQKLLRKF